MILNSLLNILKKAIEIDSNRSEGYYNLANAESENNSFSSAITNFETSIKIDPYFANAYNSLGIVQIKKGLPELAIESLKSSRKFKPDFFEVYNLAMALEDKGNLSEAFKYYFKSVLKKPDLRKTWSNNFFTSNPKN